MEAFSLPVPRLSAGDGHGDFDDGDATGNHSLGNGMSLGGIAGAQYWDEAGGKGVPPHSRT